MMILLTIISGIALSVIGILLMRPISRLLGATDAMMEDCVTYGRVVLLFNTAYMLQNVFQTFFTTAEKPKLGLFRHSRCRCYKYGSGRAFYRRISLGRCGGGACHRYQPVHRRASAAALFPAPERQPSPAHKKQGWRRASCAKACVNGSSELMSNISGSLVSMLYNFQLMRFAGENGVAAYGVLMYIQFIFIAIFIGYTIGTAPIIGYHYGAGNRGGAEKYAPQKLSADGRCRYLHDAGCQNPRRPTGSYFCRIRPGASGNDTPCFFRFFILLHPGRAEYFYFLIFYRAEQRGRLRDYFLLAYPRLPDALRPDSANFPGAGRYLVGNHGRRGARLRGFLFSSCAGKNSIPRWLSKVHAFARIYLCRKLNLDFAQRGHYDNADIT